MKNIAILTSGGDAPGMNAGIRAVVLSAAKHNITVYGIKQGYQGLIEGKLEILSPESCRNLIAKGGTVLGSVRSQAFMSPEGRKKAYENLKNYQIQDLVVIGGDGTFTGAQVFMNEYPDISIVGMPGTIDNDLYGTDYTIGYDTALNTAMLAIDKIRDTAEAHQRLFFVEVMGRDAGFVALRSGIATAAEAILIPEQETNLNELIETINRRHLQPGASCIVVVAEGDDAGNAFELAKKVEGRVAYPEIKVVVLGHIQRGGSPSCFDRVLASRLGMEAVEALLSGKKGVMLGQQGLKVVSIPFDKAIKHHQKISPYLCQLMEYLSFS